MARAHGRLYEYYKSSAKELPDTIEEMAPLFAAVMHGCQARQHQEAFAVVYWQRILREEEGYSAKNGSGHKVSDASCLRARLWSTMNHLVTR